MALITLREVLDKAAVGNYGVGGFNVNNMEQIQAIMDAARETNSPVILQASRGARTYANDKFLYHLMIAATEVYPEIPTVLHQDHGSKEACLSAVDMGFTSVMIDGSLQADHKTPASYEENVAVTKEVVAYAHAKGVSVEAELGVIGGIEDGAGAGDMKSDYLTDPDQAVQFVEETGVDALAVAIGTSHGVYKFAEKPDGSVLVMDRIIEINKRLPNTHIVMHGSSSVPQELLAQINQYGGQIKPTFGVPIEEIQLGIQHGVRKVNVDTDTRLAITAAIRKFFIEHPDKFDPREYMTEARTANKVMIAERMKAFGQAGHAGDFS
ncbi:MAG: fructose-bisphosphate aldolase class II [Candidatus Levybacteria bacterium]|nr:fructose-bisphosphate aldolase class II [Candidatus Levybacteria bacterium]